MAIICRDAHILFIMIPRTGCSAIGRTLREQLGGEFLPRHAVTDAHGKIVLSHKHNTLQQLLDAGLLTHAEADGLFKFAGVRNPFDSLVSLYMKKKHKYQKNLADPSSWVHRDPAYAEDMRFCRDHSFDEWIARHYHGSTLKRLLGRGRRSMYARFTEGVDFVVRFEHLNRDFSAALRRASVTRHVELPAVNVTGERGPSYRSYYSAASRRAVEQTFRSDLEQYGYCF
jgi:hypothetical protein